MNRLYCLIGPSGSGKDTLKFKLNIPYVISYRTREKRKGEIEGRDGNFVTEEEFLALNHEWIAKTEYAGHFYGVTRAELTTLKYHSMVYVIDWEGFQYMKGKLKGLDIKTEAVSIFIDVDASLLKERMEKQGRDEAEIKRRMLRYMEDMKPKTKCDYIITNNDTIEEATMKILTIIEDIECKN